MVRSGILMISIFTAALVVRQTTDGMILGSLGTADANILEAAKLASTKAGTKEVRDYAAMLVRDHTISQRQGLALAKRYHITITLPTDTTIEVSHKQEMDQLNLLATAEFDKAFVQYMVADHLAIIKKVDSTLAPSARNAALRAFIHRLRPTLVAHRLAGQQWLAKHP